MVSCALEANPDDGKVASSLSIWLTSCGRCSRTCCFQAGVMHLLPLPARVKMHWRRRFPFSCSEHTPTTNQVIGASYIRWGIVTLYSDVTEVPASHELAFFREKQYRVARRHPKITTDTRIGRILALKFSVIFMNPGQLRVLLPVSDCVSSSFHFGSYLLIGERRSRRC